MYITFRKYRVTRDFATVRDAVEKGLLPILRTCPGFRAHWLLNCSDGDCAGLSVFDSEEQAKAALDRTVTWVQAHIRDLLELPPHAMFGATAEQLF